MADRTRGGWEYCQLSIYSTTNDDGSPNNLGRLTHYDDKAVVETINPLHEIGDKDITVAVSSSIAELGRDGWELVSANTLLGTRGSGTEMFFKRPILEP